MSRLGLFPPLAVATEAYGPNVPIATRRLQPLGVQVVRTHPGVHDSRGPQPDGRFAERRLPFPDASFELVLAHSSAFCPVEVYLSLVAFSSSRLLSHMSLGLGVLLFGNRRGRWSRFLHETIQDQPFPADQPADNGGVDFG